MSGRRDLRARVDTLIRTPSFGNCFADLMEKKLTKCASIQLIGSHGNDSSAAKLSCDDTTASRTTEAFGRASDNVARARVGQCGGDDPPR
jgi:hypothetical protein